MYVQWYEILFFKEGDSGILLPGRLKHFLSNWQKITIDLCNPKLCTLSVSTPSCNKNEGGEKIDSTVEGRRDAEKGSNCSNSERLKEVFEFNICCSREVSRFLPCNKFKETKFLSRVEPLQNVGNITNEQTFEKDIYLCKIDLKDVYFSVPLHQNS